MRQFTLGELLKNTDDLEELLSIVENGHPSIDETHHCWEALKKLERMSEENIYTLYNEIHGY